MQKMQQMPAVVATPLQQQSALEAMQKGVLPLLPATTSDFERRMDAMVAEYLTLRQSGKLAGVGHSTRDVREGGVLPSEHTMDAHIPGGNPHNKAIPIQYVLPTSPGKLSFAKQVAGLQAMFEGKD